MIDVIRIQSHEAVHDHDISLYRAVELTVVEQPLDPGDPTSAPGHVAAEQQMEREPESASGGAFGVVQSQALAMCARPQLEAVVILADEVCRDSQLLQIVDC